MAVVSVVESARCDVGSRLVPDARCADTVCCRLAPGGVIVAGGLVLGVQNVAIVADRVCFVAGGRLVLGNGCTIDSGRGRTAVGGRFGLAVDRTCGTRRNDGGG